MDESIKSMSTLGKKKATPSECFADVEVVVDTIKSDESIESSLVGESLCSLEELFQNHSQISRCPSVVAVDDDGTTIHTTMAGPSPLSQKSNPAIHSSLRCPKVVHFPEKTPLDLIESTTMQGKLMPTGHSNIERTLDEASHHSRIFHSEHVHGSFHNSDVAVSEDSRHTSILNSEHIRDNTPSHEQESRSDSVETVSRRHPLRRSMKRLKMKSRALKSWSIGLADESHCPLLNPNAMHNQRSLDMEFQNDCSLQENIAVDAQGTVEQKSRTGGCSSPFRVLSPSFAFHRRAMSPNGTPTSRHEKPPKLPCGSPKKTTKVVRFRFD